MINPRLLQQHFQKVQARSVPDKPQIPRISNIPPLTTIQAIPTPPLELIQDELTPQILTPHEPVQPSVDVSKLQEELLEVTQALTTLKQALTQTAQIEPTSIVEPIPATAAVIEIEEKNEELPVKNISKTDTEDSNNDYDPYGYYASSIP